MHTLLISVLVVWLVVAENTTARNDPLPANAHQKRAVLLEKKDANKNENEKEVPEDVTDKDDEEEGSETVGRARLEFLGFLVLLIPIILVLGYLYKRFLYQPRPYKVDLSKWTHCLPPYDTPNRPFGMSEGIPGLHECHERMKKNQAKYRTRRAAGLPGTPEPLIKEKELTQRERLAARAAEENDQWVDIPLNEVNEEGKAEQEADPNAPGPSRLSQLKQAPRRAFEEIRRFSQKKKSLQRDSKTNRTVNNRNYNSMQKTHTHTRPLHYTSDSLFDTSMDPVIVETWAGDRKGSAEKYGAVRNGRRVDGGEEVKFDFTASLSTS